MIDRVIRWVWDRIPTHHQNRLPWAWNEWATAAAFRVDKREREERL
jgi:hypothetical protein